MLRLLRASLTLLLATLSWLHLTIIEPIVAFWEERVLALWEEWFMSLVRQAFEETTRFLNGISAWFLSTFSNERRSYRQQLRNAWQDNSWQRWWGEAASRPSTLNALVASLTAQQQKQAASAEQRPGSASGAGMQCAGDYWGPGESTKTCMGLKLPARRCRGLRQRLPHQSPRVGSGRRI